MVSRCVVPEDDGLGESWDVIGQRGRFGAACYILVGRLRRRADELIGSILQDDGAWVALRIPM